MYSDTKQQILDIIKDSTGISVNSIILALNKNASGIFRHLKKLMENGQIRKVGKPPKVLYYYQYNNMEKNIFSKKILNWATASEPEAIKSDWLCPTRDVFQARSDRLLNELKNTNDQNLAFIMAAIVGEIGNNSLDHNLGNWRDVMGLLFFADIQNRKIYLADRGQGVLSSLKRVRPDITNHEQALKIAFTDIISGRAPEQRGNGLKYVAKNVKSQKLWLEYYSGDYQCEIKNGEMAIKPSTIFVSGTLCIINY